MTCKDNQEQGNDLLYCKYFKDECIECVSGYYLDLDNKCTDTKFCTKSENGICTQCNENYFLTEKNNLCTIVEHCIDSDFYENCKECEDGFYYDKCKLKCLESNLNEKYLNCKATDKYCSFCEECKSNYYLSNVEHLCYVNTEEEKFHHCAESNEDGTACGFCESGYYLGNEDNICSLTENCAKSEGEICVECQEGFCLDLKKIEFILVVLRLMKVEICAKNAYLGLFLERMDYVLKNNLFQ